MSMNTKSVRVVWSVQSKDFTDEHINVIKSLDVAGVRISYDPEHKSQTLELLSKLQQSYGSVETMPLVLLDATPEFGGKVVGLESPIELKEGQKVTITPAGSQGKGDFSVETANWQQLFNADTPVYLGYGDGAIEITSTSDDKVEAKVTHQGVVIPNMDFHSPRSGVEKGFDYASLGVDEFIAQGVDSLILPGFMDLAEIKVLREKYPYSEAGSPLLLYRIDSEHAHSKFSSLLDVVDGVVISRKELSLTVNPALVPILTKEIIEACHKKAKLTMVASELLGSMKFNATPTRAEVSDIANAVYDGADALILSEDVASGRHSLKAHDVAKAVAADLEATQSKMERNWDAGAVEMNDELDVVCVNAIKTARRVGAKAIVCITKSGNTATRLSSINSDIPVLAVTFDKLVKRKLDILKGVEGIVLSVDPTIDQVLPEVNALLKDSSELEVGDKIVFVTVTLSSMSKKASNLFTIQTID